jgi:hypothetical protein
VGHDLIKYYGTYLAAYEACHPKDVIPYGVVGTPHSASAAARAAAAPLRPGDRIEVWWPLEKAWYAATVAGVSTDAGEVVVSYDDGDTETLRMAQERWRRERVFSDAPSKKKRVAAPGEGGARPMGSGLEPVQPGAKRKRQRPSFFSKDFVGDGAPRAGGGAGAGAGGWGGGAGGRAAGGLGGAGDDSDDGAAPFGSNLERLRQRAERRRHFGAPRARSARRARPRH